MTFYRIFIIKYFMEVIYMSNCYIINTNKKYDPNSEIEMLNDKKCAAYYSPWKEDIDGIQVNDLIFLYSNKVGIIARGTASGISEVKDYHRYVDEEHYMELDRFQKLKEPLTSSSINKIVGNNIILNQTQKPINYEDGLKIWRYITRNCL